ncbi:iron-containing redox enzyme family protein [Candidatus Woesearchaeota archaeon]|nr:iron-containing redox enzyme family protein [Candidatus Woesearchaeota archaeon]
MLQCTIEGNFLSWMGGASISARSVLSKFAVDENLLVEIKDNHPGMLRKFAKECKAEPNSEDYKYSENETNAVRKIVAELSGIKAITLMATLENTSSTFIPFLAELGKKLGCKDFTYTDVHGEADIEHANQFLEALTDEQYLGYPTPEKDIDNTIRITLILLKKVFAV